jgi:methanogenic corrinoid protein MtbC1
VLIGGLAINRFKFLADALGAEIFGADAEEAVAAANRIIVSQRKS